MDNKIKPNKDLLKGEGGGAVVATYLADQGGDDNQGGDANLDSVYEDAMSRSIKTQNYKDFYNTAIQNRVFEQNSQKYLNNTLANQGLNNMGYGTSMMAGITNAANNRASGAYDAYLQANREADQAALSRQEDDIDSLLQEITAGGERSAELNQFLVNAGYMDTDGNYTESFNALTPAQQARIKNAMAVANASQGNTGKSEAGVSLETLAGSTYGDDANAKTMSEKFRDELIALQNAANNGSLKEGDAIVIRNGNDGSEAYLVYNSDGTFSQISAEQYNASNQKKSVTGGKWDNKTVATSGLDERTKQYFNEVGRLPAEGTKFQGYVYQNGKWVKEQTSKSSYTTPWY